MSSTKGDAQNVMIQLNTMNHSSKEFSGSINCGIVPMQSEITSINIRMKREDTLQPWGLTFSEIEGHFLLGKVDAVLSKPRIQWSYTQEHPQSYAHTVYNHHRHLQPGDLVTKVNGIDSRCFTSLSSFTNHLRSLKEFTFLVLRHPYPTAAAYAVQHRLRTNNGEVQGSIPLQVAMASNYAWANILYASRHLALFRVSPSTLSHEVTPERNLSPARSENASSACRGPRAIFSKSSNVKHARCHSKKPIVAPTTWRNPWFRTDDGNQMIFVDNWEFSPEDGNRAELFLPKIANFSSWLAKRKSQWRHKYKVYKHDPRNDVKDESTEDERTVSHDFWSTQGFQTFDDWLLTSRIKWKRSFSWNRQKTQQIQQECEAIVHISQYTTEFREWLKVRRNQWRLQRRKRRRDRTDTSGAEKQPRAESLSNAETGQLVSVNQCTREVGLCKRQKLDTPVLSDIAAIDSILQKEEEMQQLRESQKQRLVDISFLFDATKGAPDVVVVHCLGFLETREYAKLLRISKAYRLGMQQRNDVWRLLCPSHWVLPRRPRKPWHDLYFHRLKIDIYNSQKRWDDLLAKCSNELLKGDHLQKIEKLVSTAEDEFGFHVNYISPVVCERNSILNLAVIHQRHKVVRWLVDKKNADMESFDRGHFTPLLNAAWAGNRQLARFLMQRGADRKKIGYNHYTKGLAQPDFEGLTAEGWATNRGHNDVAKLIRLGL